MNALLLFRSTREVIRAEAVCRLAGLACQVVAVPKDVSAECGMSISVDEAAASLATSLLAEAGLPVQVHRPVPRFDLLTTVEQGGCSAKLPLDLLLAAIRDLPVPTDPNLMVGIDTCDDAGVYRLSDDLALIQTTDFFPPVCSDPYEFGQIAATNALSDVYAMGGRVLTAMNLVMFPAKGIPMEVLREILRGGQDKITESGGVMVGGHTIADSPPKYGLAVTGVVDPRRVITNAQAQPGDILILAKPIGTGTLLAGERIGEAKPEDLRAALDTMKLLNRRGAEAMQEFGVRCATDITGFGLLGHALHIAHASRVTLDLDARAVPLLPGVLALAEMGCIPGGAFRNLGVVEGECRFAEAMPYALKLLLTDPQTSGGLFMAASASAAEALLAALRTRGYPAAAVVGRVAPPAEKPLQIRYAAG